MRCRGQHYHVGGRGHCWSADVHKSMKCQRDRNEYHRPKFPRSRGNVRCRRWSGSSRGRVRFTWPGYTERRGGTSGREDTLSPQSDATNRSSGNTSEAQRGRHSAGATEPLALTATFRWPLKTGIASATPHSRFERLTSAGVALATSNGRFEQAPKLKLPALQGILTRAVLAG